MKIIGWFERQPMSIRLGLKILSLTLLGYIDHVTGPEISFSIFYLVPIATTAWIDGTTAGVLMALTCGVIWLIADLTAGHQYTETWIPYWNMTVRIGFFAAVAVLLARLKKYTMQLQRLSRIDPLTGLWNARYFLELMEREIERCRRAGRPITFAYLDADNFKQINDTLGHAGGDALLQDVGEEVKKTLRQVDVATRLGGDEFGLLLPEIDFEHAAAALQRIKESLDRRMREKGHPVTFSVGAVTYLTSFSSVEQMIRAADDLMYCVKRGEKGTVRHEIGQPKDASPKRAQ